MAKRLAPWLLKDPVAPKTEPAPWQHAGQQNKLLDQIRVGLEDSPSKIVLIVSRDHQDNKPGSWHADQLKLPSGERGWAHVAVAFVGPDGRPVFAEKTPGAGLGALVSQNKSGTVQDMTKYREVEIIPLDLSRFGPGARERFINAFLEALSRPYSGFAKFGDHCSSAFEKGLAAAMDPSKAAVSRDFQRSTLLPNVYTPNDAYLHGKQLSVPLRYDPNSPTQGQTVKNDWLYPLQGGRGAVKKQQPAAHSADDNAESLAALSGAIGTQLVEPRASGHAGTAGEARADSLSELLAKVAPSENQDARTGDAPQQPGTDDYEEPSQGDDEEEELADASDPEHAPPHDPAQQPAIDDDVDDDDESLQDEVTLASDPEDARTDDAAQQPAIDDDDEEPLQADDEKEELADASDNEDAPTADALMQTAKAEVGADANDQAGPQLATSAPDIPDAGFSFSLFAKPGIPFEVAKEAMPAEQPSPEAIPGSGVPGSESALPDLDSANVGNAAPDHERVVHHGDLAP
jgi:hypothetical protein